MLASAPSAALLDIDNIAYVINPRNGKKITLSPAEARAKHRYIQDWRGRHQAVVDAAQFTPSPFEPATGSFGDQRPWYDRADNEKSYKPTYPPRYEEYLAARKV